MKPKLLFLGVMFVTLGCGQDDNNDDKTDTADQKETAVQKSSITTDNANHIFDIKAAKIVFNQTVGIEKGTETLYFDDYGNIAVLIVDKKSKMTTNNQTMIWKDKQTTMINHETKKVAKSPFRPKSTEPPALADISEATRTSIGYEKMPNETIAGKSCEVWFNKKMNVKYWLWNKVALKEENQGALTKEAISVEEISSIPAEVMKIPAGYN